MKSFSQQAGIQGGLGAAFPSHATFPHYAIPQGLPYHVYGYLSLSLSPHTHATRSLGSDPILYMRTPSTGLQEEGKGMMHDHT